MKDKIEIQDNLGSSVKVNSFQKYNFEKKYFLCKNVIFFFISEYA